MNVVTSPVAEDYLKIIYAATEWGGAGISVSRIAQRLGVVASTASENIKKLAESGLIVHERYGAIQLTAAGKTQALAIVRRHRLLETYLHEALGFDWDEVHEEAEILEHACSDRLLERINEYLGNPTRDPHGDLIPAADGTITSVAAIPLDEAELNQTVTLVRISDANSQMLRHLEDLGIMLDTKVKVIERLDFAGVTKLLVEGREVEVTSPVTAAIWVA